ncbi:MAG: hypothetical protein AAF844_14370 [Pseudomonadota bacterium]
MSTIKIPGLDRRPGHEDLCMAFNTLIARDIRDMFVAKGMSRQEASRAAEDAAFAVAMVFDQGKLNGGCSDFQPRLSFVDSAGSAVPVEGKFDLHDYAAAVLEFDDYE